MHASVDIRRSCRGCVVGLGSHYRVASRGSKLELAAYSARHFGSNMMVSINSGNKQRPQYITTTL